MKMFKRRFKDEIVITGEKLPAGVELADPCFPVIRVSTAGGGAVKDVISVSDDFWSDAEEVTNKYDKSFAIQEAGGQEMVNKMLYKVTVNTFWNSLTEENKSLVREKLKNYPGSEGVITHTFDLFKEGAELAGCSLADYMNPNNWAEEFFDNPV